MNDLLFLMNACDMLQVQKTVLCTARYYWHLVRCPDQSNLDDDSESEQFVFLKLLMIR